MHLPESSVFVVGVVDDGSAGGEHEVGHERHGTCKDGVARRLGLHPLQKLLQRHVAVLAHDGALVRQVVRSAHPHPAHHQRHQPQVHPSRLDPPKVLSSTKTNYY